MPLLTAYLLIVAVLTSATSDAVGQSSPSNGRSAQDHRPDHEWAVYGGDAAGTRYTPLSDITPATVSRLGVAWTFRTGDVLQGPNGSRFQATPLMVDGRLLVSTPFGNVVALRPDTGEELWRFDAHVDLEGDYGDFANRGVAYWRSAAPGDDGPCRARVFVAPIDGRLIALDAATGQRCPRFGRDGEVSLQRDLVNAPEYPGEYQVTSPPTVIGDVVVVGSAIADNRRTDAPSGVVRAFDVRTGQQRWRWDPMASRAGAANAWSMMSVDAERDLLFVPVGSASPDYYGGERPGDNRHANSVVALRGSTGTLVWAFQVVHHDIWDYDIASQPVLVTLRREGRAVPAVVQATKMGHVFVLHRETGEPLFPVEERAVPASDVPGEQAAATQPFPEPAFALAPDRLDAVSAWGASPEDLAHCRERMAGLRSEGIFTPPSLRGTLIYPGNAGGSHWGGVSWDPVRRRLLAPTNRLPFVVRLVPRADLAQARSSAGAAVETARQEGTPYGMQRELLRAPSGLPCSRPPWGVLSALDLDEGTRAWEHPLGSTPAPSPDAGAWGSVNLGGVLLSGGGLAFVAATLDGHIRAIDVDSGVERWRSRLPAGGHALPMSYRYGGRQYVVIVAGGHPRMGIPASDHVVAFALDAVAPAAPPTELWPGTYTGEFRGGRKRYDAQVTITATATGHTAAVVLRSPAASATLHGEPDGEAMRWQGTISLKERACDARIDVPLQLANGGRDVLGDGTVQGACTEGRVEPAAFSLRRR